MSAPGKQDSPHLNTVAVLGDSPVVCRAIAHLVERGGYETRVVDTMRNEPESTDVDVVLITAGTAYGRWEALNWFRIVPVLRLVDTPEEQADVEDKGVLWPCATSELHSALSRALSDHQQRDSHRQ